MWAWLQRLFGRDKTTPVGVATEDRALTFGREAQALRLELVEWELLIGRLKSDLDRQRAGESQRVDSVVDAGRERLLADAATPLVQLMTQAHLLEVAGKPVQAADVLTVAKRLMRVFETAGVVCDHIQHDYAIRHRDPATGEYQFRPIIPRGTVYPTTKPIDRMIIKATYDGQTDLGLAFKLHKQLQRLCRHQPFSPIINH